MPNSEYDSHKENNDDLEQIEFEQASDDFLDKGHQEIEKHKGLHGFLRVLLRPSEHRFSLGAIGLVAIVVVVAILWNPFDAERLGRETLKSDRKPDKGNVMVEKKKLKGSSGVAEDEFAQEQAPAEKHANSKELTVAKARKSASAKFPPQIAPPAGGADAPVARFGSAASTARGGEPATTGRSAGRGGQTGREVDMIDPEMFMTMVMANRDSILQLRADAEAGMPHLPTVTLAMHMRPPQAASDSEVMEKAKVAEGETEVEESRKAQRARKLSEEGRGMWSPGSGHDVPAPSQDIHNSDRLADSVKAFGGHIGLSDELPRSDKERTYLIAIPHSEYPRLHRFMTTLGSVSDEGLDPVSESAERFRFLLTVSLP